MSNLDVGSRGQRTDDPGLVIDVFNSVMDPEDLPPAGQLPVDGSGSRLGVEAGDRHVDGDPILRGGTDPANVLHPGEGHVEGPGDRGCR